MAEVLRDLIVTLSLQSDNFSRNITSINKQIREAESEFKLAGAGVTDYGKTTEGMSSRLSMLQKQLTYQKNAVDQYERMLKAANTRMVESNNRYTEYAGRLDEAKQKQQELLAPLREQEKYLDEIADLAGKDSDAYKAAAEEVENFKQKIESSDAYKANAEEIEKLTGQCEALQKASQKSADAVASAETKLNNAKAAVKETEAAIKSLNGQLATAQSGWTKAGTALTNFSKRMGEISKKAGELGRGLTLKVTTPLVALGKQVFQSSLDFESSFASVRKTVDATEEEFAQLQQASKQMSTQIAASTSEINEVMATGGQLGIANENLTDFTRVMIDLGNSCEDLDANTAATQLAKFANIMGTDQALFKNIGSTVVDLGNNFATTEAPIIEMSMRLAGAGKQVGLTEAQILGMATALSSVGIQAQMGGSAMSKALIKMEVAAKTGNDELQDFAKVSGMTAQEFADTWSRDPVEAFQRFISGVAELDDEGISAVQTLDAIGIKEIRLRDTMLRTVNAHELFNRAQARATAAWQQNTALETEANKRYATMAARLTNLKNKATLFAQTLGDDMRPAAEKAMQGISDFIDKLQGMDSAQRQAILRVAAIAAGIGPALLVFSKVAGLVGTVSGVLGKFATAVGASGGSLNGFIQAFTGGKGAIASFSTAVVKAGGGFKGLLSVLAASPATWFAVAAAVAFGVAKLIDWASGAKAAREAQERLNETVKEWEQNVTTAYEKSKGMSAFGLSGEDFSLTNVSGGNWLAETLKTWTDGKGETDKIVQDTVKSFTDGTDNIRTALNELKSSAGGGVVGDLDTDLEKLDGIDKEIESILKKRQNGFLSEDDVDRLQQLIDERGAISIKYNLVTDSDSAFDDIAKSAEAAISRGSDGGQVWADSYAAATQGIQAFNDSLNAEYDARYRVISAMEDEEERQKQLGELETWYNEQAAKGQKKYADTLASVAESTGAFGEGGEYESTMNGIEKVNAAMEQLADATNDHEVAAATDALNEALQGLDESQVVEVTAALVAMESAGSDMSDSMKDTLTSLSTIKELMTGGGDLFSGFDSLDKLFGAGLDEEVLEINATLNTENLSTVYDAWAAGEHADIIPAIEPIDASTVPIDGKIGVDGELLTVTTKAGQTYTLGDFKVGVDGEVTHINPLTGEEEVTGFVMVDGELKAVVPGADGPIKPDFLVGVDGKLLSINPYTGVLSDTGYSVDVNGHIQKLDNTTGEYTDTGFTYPVDGTLKSIAPDGAKLSNESWRVDVDGSLKYIDPETGVLTDSGYKYTDLVGEIGTITVAEGLVVPDIEVKAKITSTEYSSARGAGLEKIRDKSETAVQESPAANSRIPWLANILTESDADAVERYAQAVRDYFAALESGDPEMTAIALQQLNDSITNGSLADFFSNGERAKQSAEYISSGLAALADDNVQVSPEQAQALKDYLGALADSGEFDVSGLTAIAQALQELETTDGTIFENIDAEGLQTALRSAADSIDPSQFTDVGDDVAAGIGQGQAAHDFSGDASTTVANDESALRDAAASHSPAARFMPLGDDISAGIGQGMSQHDFSADAAAVMSAIESALAPEMFTGIGEQCASGISSGLASLGSTAYTAASGSLNSSTLMPIGTDAASGLASGITDYDLGSAASTAAGKVKTAVSSKLNSSTLTSIGSNVMQGLASGITSGASLAAAAAAAAARAVVAAAKAALQINSPSRVFRDEVGVMMMRGLGEGIEKETKAQAKVVRNAARYLTEEAQSNIVAGSVVTDNRQTYNQQSTVKLSGNNFYIRDDSDIHALAVEITQLGKRRQSGLGVRQGG